MAAGLWFCAAHFIGRDLFFHSILAELSLALCPGVEPCEFEPLLAPQGVGERMTLSHRVYGIGEAKGPAMGDPRVIKLS